MARTPNQDDDGTAVFIRHDDGTITVDRFPEQMLIAPRILGEVDAKILRMTIRIEVANGEATYRVIGWDAPAQALLCDRMADETPH